MLHKQQFLSSYSAFQRFHTSITMIFLAVLVIQAILFSAFSLWQVFEGYKTLLLAGIEIGLYMLISKIHERSKGIFCPNCSKSLMYRYGREALNNSGCCPHCKEQVIG